MRIPCVMTHLPLAGGAASPPPSTFPRTSIRPAPAQPAFPHPLDRQVLTLKIACRRARLAELEAEMIAACEAAAVGTWSQASAVSKHKHRDRTVWHRPHHRHPAGSSLRSPDASPSSRNRPARTADRTADRCLSGCSPRPPALPARCVRSGNTPSAPSRSRGEQAHLGNKPGKARCALARPFQRFGAIVTLPSPVHIHTLPSGAKSAEPTGEARQRGRKPSGRPANPRPDTPLQPWRTWHAPRSCKKPLVECMIANAGGSVSAA